MNAYTLSDYFREAKLPAIPEFAKNIHMKYKPFEHQLEDLNHLTSFTRSGLLNEPGTGKTLPVIAYGMWLAAQSNKVVYIMPPVLVPQFQKAVLNLYPGQEACFYADMLQGKPEERAKRTDRWNADGWPDLLITSFKMFIKYYKELLEKGYTCVVVDEATAVKSPSSQLHEAVKIFAGNHREDSNGVVLMTGSPVDTNVVDAYGLIAIIDPDRYGSMKNFEKIHCIFAPKAADSRYDQIVGYQNLGTLNRALFAQSRRVKKCDVSDLPPRLISEVVVTLGAKHRALYKKLVDERLTQLGDQLIDLTEASAIYQAMQRVLISPETYTDEVFDNEVLLALDALIETLDGKKVVVYCWYQATIEKLKERYAHLNPASLYGKTPASRREIEKMKFIEDPTCRMILANPRSGGVGVDGFQAVASHAIYAEVCPFIGVFQQSIDRLHRTGQKAESVNVYVLVPTGTIAVKLRNDLVRKDWQQEMVVQDKRTLLTALMGEGGIKGSLDKLSYEIQEDDNATLVDNYHE